MFVDLNYNFVMNVHDNIGGAKSGQSVVKYVTGHGLSDIFDPLAG